MEKPMLSWTLRILYIWSCLENKKNIEHCSIILDQMGA